MRYRALLRQGYSAPDVRSLQRLMEHLLRLDPILAQQARATMRQVEREVTGEVLLTLSDALLDFTTHADLTTWLDQQGHAPDA